MLPRPHHARHPERGVVIIWFACIIIVMMMFMGLAMDGSKMAATRTQLQNVADAAALAGASAVDSTSGLIVESIMVARAQAIAYENEAFREGPERVLPVDLDISYGENQTECHVVARRTGDRSVSAHIAQVFGMARNEMRAEATAKIEPTDKACEDLVPMGAIPPPDGFLVGCAYEYPLKHSSQDNTTGNFLLLSFPECTQGECQDMSSTGANTLNCLINHGYACCIEIGESVLTEPGDKTGPFKDALNARFDSDSDRREDICFEDYGGNRRRIINVPKITALPNGRDDVTVLGFSAFFLKRRVTAGGRNSEVWAEFVYDVIPGEGGPAENNGETFSISLIK